MQGTAINIFDRLGNALRAFKALPQPGALYPPQQQVGGPYWLTWQGWQAEDARAGSNNLDQERAKVAVQSPWVYSDVTAMANEASAAELIVKERTGDKLEDVANHPLELLWESPNPHMGRSFVTSFWVWSYTFTKAYLYWMPGADGLPAEVWPVPPFMISPLPDERDFIGGYAFKARADQPAIRIPPEYITYSHSVNIFDARDSLSFLVAAMLGIKADLAAERWNANFFDEQNAIPDGLISVNKDTIDTDLARIRQEIRDFFGGTRRGVAIARDTDMKYQAWGRAQKDMEFTKLREFSEKEIDRTLGFPQGYWSERANRANAEQARATMIAGAVWPLLVRLAEDLNAQTVKRWWGDQYRVEFKDIRPEDRELKLREIETRKAYWTLGELRELDGKDPLGDVRDLMLITEIEKGAATPTSEPSVAIEEELAAQEEEAAALAPPEEEAPPPELAAPPVEEDALEGGEAPIEEGAMPTKALDLERWERKALKDITRKGRVYRPFDSSAIPADERARISEALAGASTAEDVRGAFKGGTDDLIDSEWEGALDWAKKAANAE